MCRGGPNTLAKDWATTSPDPWRGRSRNQWHLWHRISASFRPFRRCPNGLRCRFAHGSKAAYFYDTGAICVWQYFGHDIKLASCRNNSIILCTTKRLLALKPVPKLCCFEHIYQFVFYNHDVSQGCRAPTGQVQAVVLYLATESAVTRVVRQKGSLQIRFQKGKQMARWQGKSKAKMPNAKLRTASTVTVLRPSWTPVCLFPPALWAAPGGEVRKMSLSIPFINFFAIPFPRISPWNGGLSYFLMFATRWFCQVVLEQKESKMEGRSKKTKIEEDVLKWSCNTKAVFFLWYTWHTW